MGIGKKCKFVYRVAGYTIFYDDVEGFLRDYNIDRIIALYDIAQRDLIEVGQLSDITCRIVDLTNLED